MQSYIVRDMSKYLRATSLVILASAGALLHAARLPVPNTSFESPATPFVSINIDSWQKTPKPDWYQETGGFLWTQLTGIFKNQSPGNADHIDNCDGSQALWLFAVPEVGLFQDYDSIDWRNQPPNHEFDVTFAVGHSYHLTVGVIGSGGGMAEGATLELSLYYRDAASNRISVGVTTLTNHPAVFSNNTHFVDCAVHVPSVKLTDAWAGQHLGIEFKSTVTTNLQGGYWDLDNLRLVEGPALLDPAFSNGQFAFTLVGVPSARFEILTTTDETLSSSSWTSVAILTNNNNGISLFTQAAPGANQRFFRARQLP